MRIGSAALCAMEYDDVTRSAPSARRLNTSRGKAVVTEAVRRLAAMGAVTMRIGGYGPIPKRLYASIGGPDLVRSMSWHRYVPEA